MRTIKRDIVGAFIFSNDQQILLGKNGKGGVYEDLWVIPGGGIDDGESKREALAREVKEEVGMDISGAKITGLDEVLTGQSKKVLRDSRETVLVDMTFYNYAIEFDAPASDIEIKLEDDLSEAVWTPLAQLRDKKFSPSVYRVLETLGYL